METIYILFSLDQTVLLSLVICKFNTASRISVTSTLVALDFELPNDHLRNIKLGGLIEMASK